MEAMLRTWKQPVPNTLETDPVFPATITGPIEKALETAQQNAHIKTQSAFAQQPHHPQQVFSRLPHALPTRPPENVPWFAQLPPVQFQANGYHGQEQVQNNLLHSMEVRILMNSHIESTWQRSCVDVISRPWLPVPYAASGCADRAPDLTH